MISALEAFDNDPYYDEYDEGPWAGFDPISDTFAEPGTVEYEALKQQYGKQQVARREPNDGAKDLNSDVSEKPKSLNVVYRADIRTRRPVSDDDNDPNPSPELTNGQFTLSQLGDAPPGNKHAAIYCRESHRSQKANLTDQVVSVREYAESRGYIVDAKAIFSEIASGKDPDRSEYVKARAYAILHGIPLIVRDFNRALRADLYSNINQKAQPTNAERAKFASDNAGLDLRTISKPDATPSESRSLETRQGINSKKTKTEPEKKLTRKERNIIATERKKLKKQLLEEVLRCHSEDKSNRAISSELGLKEPTVRRWLKAHRRECATFARNDCATFARNDDGWT